MRTALLLTVMCLPSAFSRAEDFVAHVVNKDSTYSACAAFDVDHDGHIDIVCGGNWYKSPSWTPHKIREVEEIRGRYDDYSHLVLDVDRDGHLDYVSANYRSKSIYWVENSGTTNKSWKKHLIARPGPMETARLADVDGDGIIDILPNGVNFAAWWEVRYEAKTPIWVEHSLPQEIAGHGVGFGDINGDGRNDLVGPRGWLEAPNDRRSGKWRWHPDFALDRDCSVPILVTDVDGDGDRDIIWGRGHNIGVYWLEQLSQGEPEPSVSQFLKKSPSGSYWIHHAIDTEVSQVHAPLMADIDGDGTKDLVVGKRYMGHEGRDPAEYDPLRVCWYRFDPQNRSWIRQVIADEYDTGLKIGFGLDSKAVDMDQDGDTDLICSGRSGVYWIENRLKRPGSDKSAVDNNIQRTTEPVLNDRLTWSSRRRHLLDLMQTVMGPIPGPEKRVPLNLQIEGEERTKSYRRIRISYQSEPGDRVPAWLLMPHEADDSLPAMLCLHQTVRIGKDEPAGLGGRSTLHYAHELANRGYVCLVPDYPSFGDYEYDFEKDDYVSGSMKAIWNNIRAVDLLQSLPQVHRDKIGVIGHSLGGHNSMFTAACDQRLQAVISSCGYTAFHDYYEGKLAGWTSARYMPRIRDVYKNDPDLVPYDFYDVVRLFAPRAFFSNSPLHDSNFEVKGVRKVIDSARKIYQLTDAVGQLRVVYPDSQHDFPDDIRLQAYDWLDVRLNSPSGR